MEESSAYKRRLATVAALTLKRTFALMRRFRVRGSVFGGRLLEREGLVTGSSKMELDLSEMV